MHIARRRRILVKSRLSGGIMKANRDSSIPNSKKDSNRRTRLIQVFLESAALREVLCSIENQRESTLKGCRGERDVHSKRRHKITVVNQVAKGCRGRCWDPGTV